MTKKNNLKINGNYISVLTLDRCDEEFRIQTILENMIEMDKFINEKNIEAKIDFIVYKNILRHNDINLLDYYVKNPLHLNYDWVHFSEHMLLYEACVESNINVIKFLLKKCYF